MPKPPAKQRAMPLDKSEARSKKTMPKAEYEKKKFSPVGNFSKPKDKGSKQARRYNNVLKRVGGDATKIPGFTFGKDTK